MIVLFCGSRSWVEDEPIRSRLLEVAAFHDNDLVVIHGDAPGADTLTEQIAGELAIHTARVGARWHNFGKAAGPIRNRAMLSLVPSRVFAFRCDGESRGTDDMVRIARSRGIPVEVVQSGTKT